MKMSPSTLFQLLSKFHHNEEGEEEDEDSGHDELDVATGDAPLLLVLLVLLVQLHPGHY